MMPAAEKDIFRQFLASRALRFTSDREAVVEAVFTSHDHFGAEELYQRLREHGVSRATVYRTLPLLVACGLLRQVILGEKQGYYEHVHREEAGHDHLICSRCGGIIEFQHPCVEKVRQAVRRRYGFEPQRVVLEISGVCRDCRTTPRTTSRTTSKGGA